MKTVKFASLFIWKWQKRSAPKIIVCAVHKKWKTLFRPSGCIVLSLKMSCISNCFHLKPAPEHLFRPLTTMSDRLWLGELKCSATGKPPVFFWTLRRCSPKCSCRVRPVSPMYSWGHWRQEMQYTMFSDLQVKRSQMVVELLGPQTWTLEDVYRQVRQRGCRHVKVPAISVWDLSEVWTRTSRRLRSRWCAITGGNWGNTTHWHHTCRSSLASWFPWRVPDLTLTKLPPRPSQRKDH